MVNRKFLLLFFVMFFIISCSNDKKTSNEDESATVDNDISSTDLESDLLINDFDNDLGSDFDNDNIDTDSADSEIISDSDNCLPPEEHKLYENAEKNYGLKLIREESEYSWDEYENYASLYIKSDEKNGSVFDFFVSENEDLYLVGFFQTIKTDYKEFLYHYKKDGKLVKYHFEGELVQATSIIKDPENQDIHITITITDSGDIDETSSQQNKGKAKTVIATLHPDDTWSFIGWEDRGWSICYSLKKIKDKFYTACAYGDVYENLGKSISFNEISKDIVKTRKIYFNEELIKIPMSLNKIEDNWSILVSHPQIIIADPNQELPDPIINLRENDFCEEKHSITFGLKNSDFLFYDEKSKTSIYSGIILKEFVYEDHSSIIGYGTLSINKSSEILSMEVGIEKQRVDNNYSESTRIYKGIESGGVFYFVGVSSGDIDDDGTPEETIIEDEEDGYWDLSPANESFIIAVDASDNVYLKQIHTELVGDSAPVLWIEKEFIYIAGINFLEPSILTDKDVFIHRIPLNEIISEKTKAKASRVTIKKSQP